MAGKMELDLSKISVDTLIKAVHQKDWYFKMLCNGTKGEIDEGVSLIKLAVSAFTITENIVYGKSKITIVRDSMGFLQSEYLPEQDPKFKDPKCYPAITIYYDNSDIKHIEIWARDGKIHNYNDEPAIITYHKDGSFCNKMWIKNNIFYERGNGECNFIKFRHPFLQDKYESRFIWISKNFHLKEKLIYDAQKDNIKALMKIIRNNINLIQTTDLLHRDLDKGAAAMIWEGLKVRTKIFAVDGEIIGQYDY